MLLWSIPFTAGCDDAAPATTPKSGLDAGARAYRDSGARDAGTVADAGRDAVASTLTAQQGGAATLPLSSGESASVAVPAGAVSADTAIEVAPTGPAPLAALEGQDAALASEPVAFTPHGESFAMPVTISFTFEGGVPAGAMMLRLDDELDTTWELIQSSVSGNTISAEVTSFSVYTVATGAVCHQADPDSDGDGICDSVDPCVAPSTDSDGNGVCDDAEARLTGTVTDAGAGNPPLASVTVTLYDDFQNLAGTTTTDANGSYFFGALSAGTYQAVVSESETCHYGSGGATLALGDTVTVDISAGCF